VNSKEAMREACAAAGVKTVARQLGVTPTALYNQINDLAKPDVLRRFVDFADATGNDLAIEWVCEELGGCFVRNPAVSVLRGMRAGDYISSSVKEFGDMLREIGESLSDGRVTKVEAVKIRKAWEELKRMLESFALSCECGFHDQVDE